MVLDGIFCRGKWVPLSLCRFDWSVMLLGVACKWRVFGSMKAATSRPSLVQVLSSSTFVFESPESSAATMSRDRQTSNRRRRFTPIALGTGVVGVAILSLSMTSTLSAFTASITDAGSVATTAAVALSEGRTGRADSVQQH